MSRANYSACLAITLAHEGGFADHPRDPGGATMRGVTQRVYDAHRRRMGRPQRTVRSISEAELQAIYRQGYWQPVRGDDLAPGVDLTVFDFGVNSGPHRAIKHLQKAAKVKADGVFGPLTFEAVGRAAGDILIKAVNRSRIGFVKSLAIFTTFGRGWTRRIAETEAKSLMMWGAFMSDHARSARLEAEADSAAQTSKHQKQGAGGAGTVGAGAGAEGQTETIGLPDFLGLDPRLLWIVAGVAALLAVLLIARAIVNSDRAKAFRKAAGDFIPKPTAD